VVESAVKANNSDNGGGYPPEESISETGGEVLGQSEKQVVAASRDDTSQERKLDIPTLTSEEALISLNHAQAALTLEVLKVLDEKFKGSLTQVRRVDERDQIF
jgi:hypothetical protein